MERRNLRAEWEAEMERRPVVFPDDCKITYDGKYRRPHFSWVLLSLGLAICSLTVIYIIWEIW